MRPWLDRPFNSQFKKPPVDAFQLEVLVVMPQWCLGKLKEVVHPRQTHAYAISMENVAILRGTVILAMAVDSRAKM